MLGLILGSLLLPGSGYLLPSPDQFSTVNSNKFAAPLLSSPSSVPIMLLLGWCCWVTLTYSHFLNCSACLLSITKSLIHSSVSSNLLWISSSIFISITEFFISDSFLYFLFVEVLTELIYCFLESSIYMTITLKQRWAICRIKNSFGSLAVTLSCSFIWDIFSVSFCLFLCIREISYVSWSWK